VFSYNGGKDAPLAAIHAFTVAASNVKGRFKAVSNANVPVPELKLTKSGE